MYIIRTLVKRFMLLSSSIHIIFLSTNHVLVTGGGGGGSLKQGCLLPFYLLKQDPNLQAIKMFFGTLRYHCCFCLFVGWLVGWLACFDVVFLICCFCLLLCFLCLFVFCFEVLSFRLKSEGQFQISGSISNQRVNFINWPQYQSFEL